MDTTGKDQERMKKGVGELLGNPVLLKEGDKVVLVPEAMVAETEVPIPKAMEEEEFDFDPSEGMEEDTKKWYAMARYYSEQRSKGMVDEMGAAWKLHKQIDITNLEANRFILEFDREDEYNYVLNEGPWKHKGDTLIVVPYNGLSRPSEIVIDSVDLWGKVAYPLEEVLKPMVEAKIKEKGMMQFEVRCGRMGHSEKFCPEDEETKVEGKFGEWLRKSPHKKSVERRLVVPVAPSRVNRALNFSG
uniref:DUF4283 domain-containing protein n=1 Tax=Setaria viridis TaxID=4556 RepID=A0A4V6D623_SETVI|nr:hypothetical protein SEVIR_5G047700v2 [Setaria viridis]